MVMSDAEETLTKLLIEVTEQRVILKNMQEDLLEIKANLMSNYVTKEQFEPVQRLVYGLVALILIAVVTGLLASIIGGRIP